MNKIKGNDFDVAKAISKQIPFFSCYGIFYNQGYQKDIARYMYCKDFGISPYKGSYPDQPYKWIVKSQIIKASFSKLEDMEYAKIKKGSK